MVTGEPSGESTLAGDRIVAHPSAFGIVRMIGVEIRGCVECGLAPAGAEQQTDRKARKQSGYGQHEGNHVTPGGLAKPNWPIGIFSFRRMITVAQACKASCDMTAWTQSKPSGSSFTTE